MMILIGVDIVQGEGPVELSECPSAVESMYVTSDLQEVPHLGTLSCIRSALQRCAAGY